MRQLGSDPLRQRHPAAGDAQQDEIAGAVDINPHRHGYFMPGTGHRILGPDDLVELQPDAVIVMNPIYKEEITLDLAKRGLNPRMFAIDDGLETVREGS